MLKLGFNEGISNSDYHDDREFISSSGLKLILKDPRAFHRLYVLNEESDKPNSAALDFGSYLHCLILEPHLLEEEFAIFTGARRAGKAWEDFQKENEGKILISKSQEMQAKILIDNFNATKVWIGEGENEVEVPLSSFYQGGEAEETLCVDLEGVKVKVRFDYRIEGEESGAIYDLKTTSEYANNPESVERICALYGYDVSAALYVDAVEQETGKPHDFYFTFVSKKDGQSTMYKASEQMLEEGRKKYKKGIDRLIKARETGIYYRNVIQEIRSIEL